MEADKKKRIEELVKKMIEADDIVGLKELDRRQKPHCVGCQVPLMEGKNVRRGYHLMICTTCRKEYLDEMGKEILGDTNGQ